MPIKKVTVYETSDGRTFPEMRQAEVHELSLKFERLFDAKLPAWDKKLTSGDVWRFIVANHSKIDDLLSRRSWFTSQIEQAGEKERET